MIKTWIACVKDFSPDCNLTQCWLYLEMIAHAAAVLWELRELRKQQTVMVIVWTNVAILKFYFYNINLDVYSYFVMSLCKGSRKNS